MHGPSTHHDDLLFSMCYLPCTWGISSSSPEHFLLVMVSFSSSFSSMSYYYTWSISAAICDERCSHACRRRRRRWPVGDNKINYRGLAQTQCAHLDRFFCAVRVVQLALLSPYPKVRARARPNATLRAHFPASLANFAHLTRTSRPPLTPRLRAAQTTPFVFCGRFYRYARATPHPYSYDAPNAAITRREP